MSGYVIAIRREYQKPEEIYSQAPSENSAILRADRLYNQLLLDSVAVIEVNSKNGFINVPYQRTRKCKHINIQFVLTGTGINPVCENCGIVMIPIEEEIENEAGRPNSS